MPKTIVSGDSDIVDDRERTLRERRTKLTKWKQKKAEFDTQKKKQEITNTEISKQVDKLSERRSRLEAWKKKKQISDKKKGSSSITTNPKKQKSKNKRPVLDDSDEEEEAPKLKLFKPNETNKEFEQESISKTTPQNIENDPLEIYMQKLNQSSHSTEQIGSEVLDDDYGITESLNQDLEDPDTELAHLAKIKSKKQVRRIDYAHENLEPFIKNFYTEPEEIRNMAAEEVDELRLGLDNIKVRGNDCPKPIVKWSQLGLTTDIMDLITKEFKFVTPTPIQAQAIPAIMSGRDLVGISKTGSGKTVSFLLPLLRQIKAQRPLSKTETGPMGLILAPTRELAVQIYEEVVKFTTGSGSIRSICCTGGSELKQQINDLKKGVEVVVATPGRFIDLLTLNSGRLLSTERITFVVMDEADRLFDLGFDPQITQIMKAVRPDKQCVLFSATFPNKLKNFALKILQKPISITINSKSLINENIEQRLKIFQTDNEKFAAMLEVLESRNMRDEEAGDDEDNEDDDGRRDEKTIVFVSSQQICDLIYNRLLEHGYVTYAIHAGKPYNERASNLEKFKNTPNGILLCTEVLSRGLNVPEVSLVIIYNAVKTFAQYVHTTGRTARGTNKGVALTMLLEGELAASYILAKSIRDSEVENHDPRTIQKLKDMSGQFEQGIKSGKYRLAKGFGGKGLDHMEKLHDEKQHEERKQYGIEENKKKESTSVEAQENDVDSASIHVPTLRYVALQNKNPDGSTTYSAEVNINDLPQLVRWEATKNTTLSSIKHETGCSITNKGKFYAEGNSPKSDKDEPKLYLLIEANEEKDVRMAVELLESKVKEGVKKASLQEVKSGKFSL